LAEGQSEKRDTRTEEKEEITHAGSEAFCGVSGGVFGR
jgi:hypothetical protein